MPVHSGYIEQFLAKVEGPCQRRGYVPATRLTDGKGKNYIGPAGTPSLGCECAACGRPEQFRAMNASGVTIATGCDLGQTDAATLAAYGLAESVIKTFRPYLGKRKAAAIALLAARPLAISQAEAELADRAVHDGYLRHYVLPAWNRAAAAGFDTLPGQAQAVIMSVCYQKGCGGVARDWPRLWQFLTSLAWADAAHELETGFRQFRNRRKQEAAILRELI